MVKFEEKNIIMIFVDVKLLLYVWVCVGGQCKREGESTFIKYIYCIHEHDIFCSSVLKSVFKSIVVTDKN